MPIETPPTAEDTTAMKITFEIPDDVAAALRHAMPLTHLGDYVRATILLRSFLLGGPQPDGYGCGAQALMKALEIVEDDPNVSFDQALDFARRPISRAVRDAFEDGVDEEE